KVDSPSINDTFQVLNFTLSFRDSLTDAAIYHIKNRGHLTLQLKNARGGWDSLVTQTMSSYNGAQTHSFRIHVNPLSLRHNAEIRLLFTDAACELSGNAVNVKITNGNAVTFLTQLNSPLTYQESEHFIPFDNCNVPGKPASGSILWLRFEEPSGLITNNPFYDSSGKRNHIQTNVGVAQSQTCYVDKCVGFNANRQSYLEIPASDSLFTSDPISLEMNLYPEQGNTWQGLISKGNGVDAYDYHVALTPRNTVGFYTEQGSVWYESSRTIPLNAWTHLVVTIDDCETAPIDGAHLGCHLRMFINGVEDTIIVPPNANSVIEVDLGLPMGQSAINVGAWSGTARLYPYTGLIDNLIIYKKALSQTEVYQQLGSVGRV
ncbi:MAG: LamG domain-containing protein, partial [Candidatus Nanoarchaeia archaeon]